ncbi:MAG: [acyl-carrier-protein] S-malonyltransferase [Flavobacteriales bacterium]|nr:[acyl-carrier-protein] S-malonyltransferase [Flavobacteriales bacterium]
MSKAFVFPGQGAQYPGMGKELYNNNDAAKALFDQADDVLSFSLSKVMFEGTAEELKETKVTQPAIFTLSVIMANLLGSDFNPTLVAGHSLGEFSALTAAGALSFENALKLVSTRASAMQKACEAKPSTMAAVLGLSDEQVEDVCNRTEGIVVAANYNCPGQLVISGEIDAINAACELAKEAGARRALVLPVGGAFHSPLMQPAREELASAIATTAFNTPICPVVQNSVAKAILDPNEIKQNLIDQLTAPVKWTQSIQQMIALGVHEYVECGPGKTLQGLIKKIDRSTEVSGISFE